MMFMIGVELFSFVNFVIEDAKCMLNQIKIKIRSILCFKNFNNRQTLIDKEEDTISFNICLQIKKLVLILLINHICHLEHTRVY